jgi:DNA-binding MurR/RpiR family transcriptional regulator
MLKAGVPIAKVAKIVGWSTATMVRMAARYGHFRLNELRGAMESNSSATFEGESLVDSPVSEEASGGARANQLKGLAPEVGLEPTTLRLTGQS